MGDGAALAAKHSDKQRTLFADRDRSPSAALRRRRPLILPRYLKEEADNLKHQGIDLEKPHLIIVQWADLQSEGHLQRKETSINADFLNGVFGEALGYKTATQSPEHYNLEREYAVPGGQSADGALGHFGPESTQVPTAVIELKDAETDLDRDKFNGRTPVQQCWDYLNAVPDCPWGIVSNFVTFRLYHRDKTPLAFEHFTLQELRDKRRFREFYLLFSRDGLLPSRLMKVPTALRLLRETDNRQRKVGGDLSACVHAQAGVKTEPSSRPFSPDMLPAPAVSSDLRIMGGPRLGRAEGWKRWRRASSPNARTLVLVGVWPSSGARSLRGMP